MPTIQKFEDLKVWRLSREIVNEIYKITNSNKIKNDYALRNQMRRSAISVMSNISEGFESGTDKQFARFLNIAKGSCGECRAQMYIALDQNYVNSAMFENLKSKLLKCSKMLSKLITYLNNNSDSNETNEFIIPYE